MKQVLVQEKYPVFTLEIQKEETIYKSCSEIIAYLKDKIDAHKVAVFISIFDHFSHTKNLENGEVNPDIKDAQNIVFCFGAKLPNAGVMAVRPRSIGVTEFEDNFIINFLEPPMPLATKAMEEWVKSL